MYPYVRILQIHIYYSIIRPTDDCYFYSSTFAFIVIRQKGYSDSPIAEYVKMTDHSFDHPNIFDVL